MPIHTGRLLLCMQDPYLCPERSRLTAALSAAGFVGAPLPGQANAFAVGDEFLQLITFVGCSVRIELSPDADGPFCHVRLTGAFRHPRFLSGHNTRAPRCHNCRTPLQSWREHQAQWSSGRTDDIPCPTCGEPRPPWAYDWKDQAGFGRVFIQVEEVFPGEAAPTPGFGELLAHISGSAWQHFYTQDG